MKYLNITQRFKCLEFISHNDFWLFWFSLAIVCLKDRFGLSHLIRSYAALGSIFILIVRWIIHSVLSYALCLRFIAIDAAFV